MFTAFNLGDQVLLKGIVKGMRVDNNKNVHYTIELRENACLSSKIIQVDEDTLLKYSSHSNEIL